MTSNNERIVKIRLKPLEPYFLGGMNANNADEKKYLIKSKKIPSQTTLFGVMRYLGIKNPNINFNYKNEKTDIYDRIGKSSFYILENESNSFGKILEISPVFLEKISEKNDESKKCLVRAPKDYNGTKKEDDGLTYEALKYHNIWTLEGEKPIPDLGNTKDYKFKEFIEIDENDFKTAWLSNSKADTNSTNEDSNEQSNEESKLVVKKDNCLDFTEKKFLEKDEEKEIFKTQSKIGIKVSDGIKTDENFYRKEFAILNGYSFCFYARVKFDYEDEQNRDDFYNIENKLVYMGQGKSTFSASVEDLGDYFIEKSEKADVTDTNTDEKNYFKYCAMSDVYLGGLIEEDTKNKNGKEDKDDKGNKVGNYTMDKVLAKLGVKYIYSDTEPYRQLINNGCKYVKNAEQLNMISAGSVFIVAQGKAKYFEDKINNKHLRIIGLNNVVKMADEVIFE